MKSSFIAVQGGVVMVYEHPEGILKEAPGDLPTFAQLLKKELRKRRRVVLLGEEAEALLEEAQLLARGGHPVGLLVQSLVPPGARVAQDDLARKVLEDMATLRDFYQAARAVGTAEA